MNSKTQLQLAKEAGEITLPSATFRTWAEEYKHHLGMVKEPLLFFQFKIKFEILDRLFEADPEGENRSLDRSITRLCNELGY